MKKKIIRKILSTLPEKDKRFLRRINYFVQEIFRLAVAEFRYALVWPFINSGQLKDITKFEQRIYSQNGEDGVIKAIFDKIGTTNKFCVEFGVGDGRECNTRYLIERKGWNFLMMDSFASDNRRIMKEFITAENINMLFNKYNVPKEFDLLSIDLDYNTYWVWKAIKGYSPRVVVIEYNSQIPVNENKVVKYNPKGMWDKTSYFGASLLALTKLGNKKGYTLVGCDSNGINAFFIRNDLVSEEIVIKKIEEIYKPPSYPLRPKSNEEFVEDRI